MYVKNLLNCSLLLKPPAQVAETNRLPLCYAKHLLGKRYVYIEAEIG